MRYHQSEFKREGSDGKDEKSSEAISKEEFDKQSLREGSDSEEEAAKRDDSVRKSTESFKTRIKSAAKTNRRRKQEEDNMVPCVRPMCEFEEGWHLARSFLSAEDLLTPGGSQYSSYLARIMNILRNGNLSTELMIFISEKGNKILDDLEGHAKLSDTDMSESYSALRKRFISEFEKNNVIPFSNRAHVLQDPKAKEKANLEVKTETPRAVKRGKCDIFGLQRCEMKNGKVLWLCDQHAQASGGKILDDLAESVAANYEESNKMLENVDNVDVTMLE